MKKILILLIILFNCMLSFSNDYENYDIDIDNEFIYFEKNEELFKYTRYAVPASSSRYKKTSNVNVRNNVHNKSFQMASIRKSSVMAYLSY